MEIESTSARDLWKKALQCIREKGDSFIDHDKRTCIELLNLTVVLTNMSDILSPIDIMSQSKKWIYPKSKEIENFVLDGYLSPSFSYSYGERLFLYPAEKPINQIDSYIIPVLQNDPNSRRAIASIWAPRKDSFLKRNVPGLIYLDFKLRDGKLHVSGAIRSCDCFIGFPVNIYEMYLLASYVASKLSCEVGNLTIRLESAHTFTDYADDIAKLGI